ncbi:hypothetical protein A6X21_12205 [Planctopirus hydrillae]|uniref:Uncharacterized protein n=1 Tax=Planctopirus hydrillae TaxID=1841610 RepID=A0A1C3E5E3_9PLAN|nr:hypothetical protein A6X21_12205 [Planctopirus hydrillae]
MPGSLHRMVRQLLSHLNNKWNGVTGHMGAKTTTEPAAIKTDVTTATTVTLRRVQVELTAHQSNTPNPSIAKTAMNAITPYFSVPKNVLMS